MTDCRTPAVLWACSCVVVEVVVADDDGVEKKRWLWAIVVVDTAVCPLSESR